jgi:hypothetical protein
MLMKLEARDQSILKLNKQVLHLHEEMREQSDWHTLHMAQLRMTHQQEKDAWSRRSKATAGKQVDTAAIQQTRRRLSQPELDEKENSVARAARPECKVSVELEGSVESVDQGPMSSGTEARSVSGL